MGLVTHLHSYDPSWKMIVLSKILGVLCQSLVLQYQSLLRHFFFFCILTPQKFVVCQFNWQPFFHLWW